MNKKILQTMTKESEARTTCTLSIQGNESLDFLTKEINLTQKQVFDYFMNNNDFDPNLMDILLEVSTSNKIHYQRDIRKSVVITRKNLKILNNTSKKIGISRDIIIDFGFKYLASALKSLIEQQKTQYKKANSALYDLLNNAEKIEKDLKNNLGQGDALLERISIVNVIISNLISELEESIKNNTPISPEGM